MDLIALGTTRFDHDVAANANNLTENALSADEGPSGFMGGSVAESVAVHRILSWQSLLMLKANHLTSSPCSSNSVGGGGDGGSIHGICVDDIEREYDANHDALRGLSVEAEARAVTTKGATSVCWAPDGRCLAIGLADGGVLIHTVEPDAARVEAAAVVAATASSGGEAHGGALHVIRPPPPPPPSPPPSLLSSGKQLLSASTGSNGDGKCNRPLHKPLTFSPRVTRSMAAASDASATPSAAVTAAVSSTKFESSNRSDGGSSSGSGSGEDSSRTDQRRLSSPEVVGLAWHRLSPRRLARIIGDGDRERLEFWRHASRLVRRGAHFLPPLATALTGGKTGHRGDAGAPQLCAGAAHLTVLCVATTTALHWYLQGQYRLLSVPHGLMLGSGASINMVCSPDLSTVLAVVSRTAATGLALQTSSPSATRGTMPPLTAAATKARLCRSTLLPKKRFELQILTASYRSLFSHLSNLQQGIRAALDSWRAALRPLDEKFSGLLQLFSQYGVSGNSDDGGKLYASSLRRELLRSILAGRSTIAGPAAGALDQFFTRRPQMHDQLLQREARGIEAGVAALEGALRAGVQGAARVVAYEAGELLGMSRAQPCDGMAGCGSPCLIDPVVALRLCRQSQALCLAVDTCLARVVVARCNLRDLLGWIRGTASQVRARGTAADSVQRQNARDRRKADGVVRRVATFLSSPDGCTTNGGGEGDRRALTESVIGVHLSDFFLPPEGVQQPETTNSQGEAVPPHCLASIVQSLFQACTILFDKPRKVFAQSLNTLDICFEVPHFVIAVHNRIGVGPGGANSRGKLDRACGAFLPRTNNINNASIVECPFWTLLARSLGPTVEIILVPGTTHSEIASTYLQTNLVMPKDAEVTNIVFYGDDGVSSLSPNLNNESEIKEGRQSLGLVVSRETREELWILNYDDILFQRFLIKRSSDDEVTIPATTLNEKGCISLTVTDEEDDDNIRIKRRHIYTHQRNSQTYRQPQVSLCGSRGTGGVITYGAATSLTIFDLEEDEDSTDGDIDCIGEDMSVN